MITKALFSVGQMFTGIALLKIIKKEKSNNATKQKTNQTNYHSFANHNYYLSIFSYLSCQDRSLLLFFYNSISPALQKPEDKTININSASQEELTSVLQIREPFAKKIITLREELGGFKEPQDLIQLSEITNLEWEEWKEQGVTITI